MNKCIKSKPKSNWTNIRITVAKMLLDIFAVNISMSCPCILFSFTLKNGIHFSVYKSTRKKKLPKLSSPLQAVFITKSFAALIISSQILSWLQYNGDFFCCSVGAHILYFTTAYAFFIYLNRIACHSNWPCFFPTLWHVCSLLCFPKFFKRFFLF